ncbi:uncharacterized protein LOC129593965 isoform X2 [Paramacrobiotus metropolitanus]|uniref:uncharacterized protein LOC129593965 isoform X2 n=1 Tax=Paramacrobiotus metropolitanus TaxID=2943436 RepID=UPI0024464153|nr:uncharacterized protein LOC129593965 isoform X2 [Paramacrobiotus metropolitanus]
MEIQSVDNVSHGQPPALSSEKLPPPTEENTAPGAVAASADSAEMEISSSADLSPSQPPCISSDSLPSTSAVISQPTDLNAAPGAVAMSTDSVEMEIESPADLSPSQPPCVSPDNLSSTSSVISQLSDINATPGAVAASADISEPTPMEIESPADLSPSQPPSVSPYNLPNSSAVISPLADITAAAGAVATNIETTEATPMEIHSPADLSPSQSPAPSPVDSLSSPYQLRIDVQSPADLSPSQPPSPRPDTPLATDLPPVEIDASLASKNQRISPTPKFSSLDTPRSPDKSGRFNFPPAGAAATRPSWLALAARGPPPRVVANPPLGRFFERPRPHPIFSAEDATTTATGSPAVATGSPVAAETERPPLAPSPQSSETSEGPSGDEKMTPEVGTPPKPAAPTGTVEALRLIPLPAEPRHPDPGPSAPLPWSREMFAAAAPEKAAPEPAAAILQPVPWAVEIPAPASPSPHPADPRLTGVQGSIFFTEPAPVPPPPPASPSKPPASPPKPLEGFSLSDLEFHNRVLDHLLARHISRGGAGKWEMSEWPGQAPRYSNDKVTAYYDAALLHVARVLIGEVRELFTRINNQPPNVRAAKTEDDVELLLVEDNRHSPDKQNGVARLPRIRLTGSAQSLRPFKPYDLVVLGGIFQAGSGPFAKLCLGCVVLVSGGEMHILLSGQSEPLPLQQTVRVHRKLTSLKLAQFQTKGLFRLCKSDRVACPFRTPIVTLDREAFRPPAVDPAQLDRVGVVHARLNPEQRRAVCWIVQAVKGKEPRLLVVQGQPWTGKHLVLVTALFFLGRACPGRKALVVLPTEEAALRAVRRIASLWKTIMKDGAASAPVAFWENQRFWEKKHNKLDDVAAFLLNQRQHGAAARERLAQCRVLVTSVEQAVSAALQDALDPGSLACIIVSEAGRMSELDLVMALTAFPGVRHAVLLGCPFEIPLHCEDGRELRRGGLDESFLARLWRQPPSVTEAIPALNCQPMERKAGEAPWPFAPLKMLLLPNDARVDEAAFVAQLVKQILLRNISASSVSVLTRSSRQLVALGEHLKRTAPSDPGVKVLPVCAFQGYRSPLVLFSAAGEACLAAAEDKERRRLFVAMCGALHTLIVVAKANTIRDSGVWLQLEKYAKERRVCVALSGTEEAGEVLRRHLLPAAGAVSAQQPAG